MKRLFIADNAALANGLGGPNPTLTSQALATRTAEKIFQTYFDGDPWVGTEAPISSIDDRVTSAVLGQPLGPPAAGPAPGTSGGPRIPATGGGASRAALAAAVGAAAAVEIGRRRVLHAAPAPTDPPD